MTTITSTDMATLLANVTKLDEVASGTGLTTPSGLKTLRGLLAQLGYTVAVPYAGGIVNGTGDGNKTVEVGGITYAPLISALPFTTSGTWVGDDLDRYRTIAMDDAGVVNAGDRALVRKTYRYHSSAAAASHSAAAEGFVIRGEFFDGAWTAGSGASFRFSGTTTAGKAGGWPNADGYFYDADGKQFAFVGSLVNALAFGARGDGVANDRPPIQIVIDYCSVIGGGVAFLPDSTYLLVLIGYPGSGAAGICGLVMKDNVVLRGASHSAVITVGSGVYGPGAFSRIITSLGYTAAEPGLSNAVVENLTVDGRSSTQLASAQCSNIQMSPLVNVIVRNVESIHSSGMGVMFQSPVGTVGLNTAILDCNVYDCTNIGIQVSQFERLTIAGNRVDDCVNNAIDIYGENGTTTPAGGDYVITNNICSNSLTGVFPETVKNGIVSNNAISNCINSGIHSNRINGAPSGLAVVGNFIRDCPKGVWMTGDNDQIFVSGNSINDCPAPIQCGGGVGNSSQITVTGNYLDGFTFAFTINTTNASFIRFANNFCKLLAVGTALSETISGTKTACNFDAPIPQQSSERYGAPVNYDADNVANTVTIPSYFRNSGGQMQTYAQEIWGSPATSGGSTGGSWAIETRSAGVMQRMIDVNANALAFYGAVPTPKQTVTGAKGGNAALTSLIARLVAIGLLNDSTT
jgi:hypothetical protein